MKKAVSRKLAAFFSFLVLIVPVPQNFINPAKYVTSSGKTSRRIMAMMNDGRNQMTPLNTVDNWMSFAIPETT